VKNPIVLAEEWLAKRNSGQFHSISELGKAVGVSHTWVRKVLELNNLCENVKEAMITLGDEIPKGLLPVEWLAQLATKPQAKQCEEARNMLAIMESFQ
jgi:hypothetical protein